MLWDCAICGKQHQHTPDLARDVHFPTRESAAKMGYRIDPKQKPPTVDPALLDELARAAESCKQRAAKCTSIGLYDLAGCWTRCQADLEATIAHRRKYDKTNLNAAYGPVGAPRTSLADQTETEFVDHGERVPNLFTGELEKPHEPAKRKRGRRVV
jgi:hypothetical protein